MSQGIDSLVGNRLDAYGSDPQALMERFQITGETVDLLALQAAANAVNEAKTTMLASAETEMPNEKQALAQEVVEGSRGQILSQLAPGIQQQGQQMQQAAMQQFQPPQQQQQPGQPANNMMMAGGGIVSFADGGSVQPIPALMDKYGSEMVMGFLEGEKQLKEESKYVAPEYADAYKQKRDNFYSHYPQGFLEELYTVRGGPIDISEDLLMAEGGIVGFANGGDVEKALYDEMGKQYLPGQPIPDGWQTLTNAPRKIQLPFNPAGGDFAEELREMERTRREHSTRTIPEFLSDFTFSRSNTAREALRSPLPALLQSLVDSGSMSNQEAVNELQKILSGPKSMGQRRQWNKENPDFLSQLEAMKESRERVLDAQEEGMAGGGIVGFAGPQGSSVGGDNIEALLDALMVAESGGNPNAVSSAGAEGAYQIMPSTAADPGFGVPPMEGDRFDPSASRSFARQYLQAFIDRYDGDIEAALIAYNAGATNADRFIAAGRDYSVLPQAAQTEPYVRKVMGQMEAQGSEERSRNINPRGRRDFSTNLNPPEAQGLMAQSQQRVATDRGGADRAGSPSRNVNPRGRRDFSTNLNPPEAKGLMARSQQRAAADRGGLASIETSEGVEGVGGALEYLQSIGRQQDQSAEGALDYLQNIGAQQEDRRARFDRAFPDVKPAVARAEQEKADGGIGYLRRLARKQEGRRQEGSRAARYLAMMQDSQNMINAADPAGRTRGQETPAADPDVLRYLAMLQENQNMVDAAGMPVEEETEDVTTLIAGRGFDNGGDVNGVVDLDARSAAREATVGSLSAEHYPESNRRQYARPRSKDEEEIERLIQQRDQREQLREAGIDPTSVEGGLRPLLKEILDPREWDWVGSEGRRRLQQEQRGQELKEQFPNLGPDQIRAIISTEVAKGGLNQEGRIEGGEFVPASPELIAARGGGFDGEQEEPVPEPEVVVEEVEEVEVEDTSIKPNWDMLREWGAGGMGATTTADALGGSGRAVGAEIGRQEKMALEGRILTVKEAQMQIDKEIALAVSQQRMTSDVLDAIADLRSEPQIYYSRIGAQMGGMAIDEVMQLLQESDPAAIAAQLAVERQVMSTMGMGMLGSGGAPPVDIVAEATALNVGA